MSQAWPPEPEWYLTPEGELCSRWFRVVIEDNLAILDGNFTSRELRMLADILDGAPPIVPLPVWAPEPREALPQKSFASYILLLKTAVTQIVNNNNFIENLTDPTITKNRPPSHSPYLPTTSPYQRRR